MSKSKNNCIVASSREMQLCNSCGDRATQGATVYATGSLKALACRVLEGRYCNTSRNNSATSELHERKATELRYWIKEVSEAYGGDDPSFLHEYTETVVHDWAHDLDGAIKCFRDVAQNPVNNRKKQEYI